MSMIYLHWREEIINQANRENITFNEAIDNIINRYKDLMCKEILKGMSYPTQSYYIIKELEYIKQQELLKIKIDNF